MSCYTTWSRVKVETQRSVTCNLMKKGGTGDGGGGAFGDVTCNKQKVICPPPLPSLFPPFEVTGSILAKCVVTEALQVYCNSLSPSPKVIVYFRLIL